MGTLWNKEIEKQFFAGLINTHTCTPDQLFYRTDDGKFLAYWPNRYPGAKSTLQTRNSFIGEYTEKWSRDLIQSAINEKDLFSVCNVICDELGLTSGSPADVAICRTNDRNQTPENILMLFEVKMSIVWNWEMKHRNGRDFLCIGDYLTHEGTPGLLRSDTMLKAIGKSINIRVSSPKASTIPIIVLGNTPIKKSYYIKADEIKNAGIVQGFWSVNPKPLDNENEESIKATKKEGFLRFNDFNEFQVALNAMMTQKLNYFSGMKSQSELGAIIEKAGLGKTYEQKAEIFIKLIRE